MANEVPAPPGPSGEGAESDRRLWFDYLTKVNDRALQSSRLSGFTPWALVGLAAAIVFRFGPSVPTYLSLPSAVSGGSAILALEADCLFFLLAAAVFLIKYASPGSKVRLLADQSRRAHHVALWVIRGAVAASLPRVAAR